MSPVTILNVAINFVFIVQCHLIQFMNMVNLITGQIVGTMPNHIIKYTFLIIVLNATI